MKTPAVAVLAGLAVTLVALAPLHADVLRVDASGAGDFTDLPAAVAAAHDGDVLLLASGVYSGVTIDALALHLVGDGPSVRIEGHVVIRNLAQGQRVALSALVIAPPFPAVFDMHTMSQIPPALSIVDCLGAVRVERATILAATLQVNDGGCTSDFGSWPPGRDAMVVRSSADVVVEGSLLVGGYGFDGAHAFLCLESGSNGGRGLTVHDSHVDLHEVIARGADGAKQGYGGIGGVAIDVLGSSDLLLSGVVATGGDGGDSFDFIGTDPISDGGDGLRTGPGVLVRFVGGFYSGGETGIACCWTPSPGEDKHLEGPSVDYAGDAHRFLTDSPAREGENLGLSITGAAGDLAFLLVGLGPINLPKPGFAGAIYVAPPFLLGPTPLAPMGDGITNYSLPVPDFGPGIDVVSFDMQLFVQESGGAKHLTGPAQVVLLDSSF